MSIWTHVLGVIRFDSMALNCWPVPTNQNEILDEQLNLINVQFQSHIPDGSEGPLDVKIFITDRGPTVTITGDLRDFGVGNIEEIFNWVANNCTSIKEKVKSMIHPMWLRDCCIKCEVEYNEDTILIEDDYDSENHNHIIVMNTYSKVKNEKVQN